MSLERKMESPPLKLAFLVVLFATITCSTAINLPQPEATITDIDLNDFSREGISLTFKVSIKNPYAVPIPISTTDYTFKSQSTVVASGNIPDPGTLKGKGSTMVDVNVKIPHNAIVTLLKDVASDADIDYDVEIKIKVDLPVIGHFTIPVNKKGEMKLLPWRKEYA